MQNKHCEFCGKEFPVRESVYDRTKYCSRLCRKRQVEKTCPTCGRAFNVAQSIAPRRVYCSYRCRNVGIRGPGVYEPNWKCCICGKEEHVAPCWLGKKKTCSWACRNKHLSIIRSGENGTNWKGGVALISRYIRTSRTMKKWIADVLATTDGKCAECGIVADHAHHIQGFAELLAAMFDVANGVPLCSDCHAQKPDHNANFVRRPHSGG